MQSSKRHLAIALTALLGCAALWHFARQSESHLDREGQKSSQTHPAEEIPAPGRRQAAQRSESAGAEPLERRTDLKREGEKSAPIVFSVLEMKTRKPIAGALVSVYDEEGGIPLEETFSDGQGEGAFEASEGRYRIEAVQDGYQKGKAAFAHHPLQGASRQTVFLSAAFYMRGTVRNEQGQALADADVILKASGQQEAFLKTDSQGTFEISLPPAVYRVEVRKEPYPPKVKPFIPVGPRNAPVLDIVLKKP